jgi:hypothetical protein
LTAFQIDTRPQASAAAGAFEKVAAWRAYVEDLQTPGNDKSGLLLGRERKDAKLIRPESRVKFEKLGLQYVRKDIGFGFSIDDELQTAEAKEWMHEQETKLERREAWRFWSMLIFTFIAAVAACIAAEKTGSRRLRARAY